MSKSLSFSTNWTDETCCRFDRSIAVVDLQAADTDLVHLTDDLNHVITAAAAGLDCGNPSTSLWMTH